MELYRATNGAQWLRSDHWGISRSVCKWYGVTCDNDGYVVAMYGMPSYCQCTLHACALTPTLMTVSAQQPLKQPHGWYSALWPWPP
jgi:hypothetical protein